MGARWVQRAGWTDTDIGGSRQLSSIGNLDFNDRVALFTKDHPRIDSESSSPY
jgi:hypothetical protein